jgi:hypothetical protein
LKWHLLEIDFIKKNIGIEFSNSGSLRMVLLAQHPEIVFNLFRRYTENICYIFSHTLDVIVFTNAFLCMRISRETAAGNAFGNLKHFNARARKWKFVRFTDYSECTGAVY